MKKIFQVTCVMGTRPEVLKMVPVIQALVAEKSLQVSTVVTAQHRDMLDQMLAHFDIDITADFNIMSENQTLSQLTARLLEKFTDYLKQNPCDVLVAQGDTTTTMVAALAAFYHHIPFVHIEAGLRTDDVRNPFPEELNRRIVSQIASIHCCPTETSKHNLNKEGIEKNVFVTGNTIIDTLYAFTKNIPQKTVSDKKTILVTCHRRENFGKPLENICMALKTIIAQNPDVHIIFPVHPNPNVKKIVHQYLGGIDHLALTDHMDYQTLTAVLAQCYFVLTDSGGLQEEAPALNKPVLILRDSTERPEGVQCGAAQIVGTETNNIVSKVQELLYNDALYQNMAKAPSPYGDGNAAQRIAAIVVNFLQMVESS